VGNVTFNFVATALTHPLSLDPRTTPAHRETPELSACSSANAGPALRVLRLPPPHPDPADPARKRPEGVDVHGELVDLRFQVDGGVADAPDAGLSARSGASTVSMTITSPPAAPAG
jgi:hypothetical protein